MINNKTLSLLGVVSMTVVFLNPLGKAALAGNFSRSCGEFRLNGTILSATCKDRSANPRRTSLDLNRRIGNKDGHLTISGGYASTCRNINLNGVTLRGDCRTYNGDFRATSLNLNKVISNNDGNLAFDR
jgi:hypothetical protein